MLKPLFDGEKVYLVGGFIRDCLYNPEKSSCDLDFVCQKNKSKVIAQEIADKIEGYFVPLDEKNNIYRVVFSDKKTYVDFADCIGDSIQDDLLRRDFTINALAYDVNNACLLDVTGGVEDLKKHIIREISEKNILDDPARIIRAFRFQSELGFAFSKNLTDIIKKHALELNKIAKERINAELIKLFGGEHVVEVLYSLDNNGILEFLFPEIKDIKKIPPNSHHHLNLFDHSIETVKHVLSFYKKACPEVKAHLDEEFLGGQKRLCYLNIAALLHDAGKPSTWQIEPDTGRHRFIKHDAEGANIVVPTLRSLKFSKKQIAYIQKIIKNHIYPAGVVTAEDANEKAYLRFYRKMGDEVIDLIAIAYADRHSALGPDITKEMFEKNINGLEKLLKRYFEEKNKLAPLPKLLDGKEIMDILKIPQSPQLGKIIKSLQEAQISSIVTTKDEAIKFIQDLKIVK